MTKLRFGIVADNDCIKKGTKSLVKFKKNDLNLLSI